MSADSVMMPVPASRGVSASSPDLLRPKRGRNSSRSLSAIDPAQVAEAAEQRRQKLAAKRNRNKTGVVLAPTAAEDKGPIPNAPCQACEMRQQIMKLQKSHIIELKQELEHLREENQLLMRHAARTEQEAGDLRLQQQQLRHSRGGFGDGDVEYALRLEWERDELQSERDVAVEKLTKLTEVLKTVSGATGGVDALRTVEALQAALGSGSDRDQVLALSRIPHWRDLDATVDASNAALDRAFADCDQRLRASGSRSKGLTRSTSAQLLESMREKFRPKLNELVHTSNSLKIRVQATIPGAVSGTTGGNTDAATVAKGPRDLSATL